MRDSAARSPTPPPIYSQQRGFQARKRHKARVEAGPRWSNCAVIGVACPMQAASRS
ncbi:unnamed protein product [Gadus morhua 'NCC']